MKILVRQYIMMGGGRISEILPENKHKLDKINAN